MIFHKILISKKSTVTILLITCFILLIPLIAMQFTNEVNWGVGDFVVAAVLLCSFGYLYQVLTKASNNLAMKAIIGLIILGAFGLVWVSLI